MAYYEYHRVTASSPASPLVTLLKEKGALVERDGSFFVDIKACSSELFDEEVEKYIELDGVSYEVACKDARYIPVSAREDKQEISWIHKWVENCLPAKAISKVVPDVLLSYSHQYEISRPVYLYIKDGDWTNKSGEKVVSGLYDVGSKLIRQVSNSDSYKVSVNLGEKGWGSIYVSPENLIRQSEKYVDVYLTKEQVPVYFSKDGKTEKVVMDAKWISKTFHEERKKYRMEAAKKAHEVLVVENIPAECIAKCNGETYILSIPKDDSPSGFVCVSYNDVGDTIVKSEDRNTFTLKIGDASIERNANTGSPSQKLDSSLNVRITNKEIAELLEAYKESFRTQENCEEIEDDEEREA